MYLRLNSLFPFLLIFFNQVPYCQIDTFPINCNTFPPPAEYATDVIPLCNGIDGLDQYCFTLQSSTCPDVVGNFPGCDPATSILNNPNWFAFVAGDTLLGLEIIVTNCQNVGTVNGVQIGLYERQGEFNTDLECNPSLLPLDTIPGAPLPQCDCALDTNSYSGIRTTIGSTYLLVFDGCLGDVCDIFIRVLAGGEAAPIPDASQLIFPDAGYEAPTFPDPDTICSGALEVPISTLPIANASSYLWTLPGGGEIITDSSVLIYDFQNISNQLLEFCVRGRTDCDTSSQAYCASIYTLALDTILLPEIELCGEDSVRILDQPVGPFTEIDSDTFFHVFISEPDAMRFGCPQIHQVGVQFYAVNEIINRNSIDTSCVYSNSYYSVSFELMGDDIDRLTIMGEGTRVGRQFVSDSIPSDSSFQFIVIDTLGCNSDTINGQYACPCLSSIGTMETGTIELCQNDGLDAAMYYDPTGQVIVANEIREYILSTDSTAIFSSLVQQSPSGQFYFDSMAMVTGQPYFISAIIGRSGLDGTLDITDPCLLISDQLIVIWMRPIDDLRIAASGPSITCAAQELTLWLSTEMDTADYEIEWQASMGGFIANADQRRHQLSISSPGLYTVIMRHQSIAGCETEAVIEIGQSPDLPVIFLQADEPLTCDQTEVQVTSAGSSQGIDFQYSWSGPGIVGPQDEESVIAYLPGAYQLVITNTANGCEVGAGIEVLTDREPPLAQAQSNDFLGCRTDEVLVTGEGSSVGFEYGYKWEAGQDSSSIISPPNQRDIIVSRPGLYYLTVTNFENGCVAFDQTMVEYDSNFIESADFEVIQPACDGTAGGSIGITRIEGGIPPYVFALNHTAYSDNTSFTDLTPGYYTVEIMEQSGCIYEREFRLTEPADFFVDLGDDIFMELGEIIHLNAETNIPDSLLGSITWQPLFDSINSNRLYQNISNDLGAYAISITVIDNNGCPQRDEVNVFVVFKKRVFVPTALRINSEQLSNRYVQVYADPIMTSRINRFEIFDRFGKRVFQRYNPPVELGLNLDQAWDGYIDGEPALPGVYTYFIELIYVTGQQDVISGAIHLMR